ncbi:large subunit ribosomal protein L13Ae [Sarotherodon galilaeus]
MSACCRHVLSLLLSIIGFLGTIFICARPCGKPQPSLARGLGTAAIQDLPKSLQGARVFIVFAIIIQFCGILLSVVGSKWINFEKTKVISLPVSSCWINFTISMNSNSLFLANAHRVEPGAVLYIGWAPAGLLYLGGGLLCCSFSCRNETDYEVRYSRAESVEAG